MLSRVFPWNWRRSSEQRRWTPFRRDSQVIQVDDSVNTPISRDSEQYVRGLQHEAALAAALAPAFVTDAGAGMEIGVDEGIPGSDRSVLSVRTSDGHVHAVDTFGIAREGDDFVIRAEDGSILCRGSSEEDVMEILRFMLVQWPSDEQPEDEELLEALENEELLEELDEPSENASRFDIIDIE